MHHQYLFVMECFHCDASIPEGKTLCGGCHMVTYCDAECQRADWEAGHKRHCFDVYEPSLQAITALIAANYEDAEEDIRALERQYAQAGSEAERDEILADAMEQWSPVEGYWRAKRKARKAKRLRKKGKETKSKVLKGVYTGVARRKERQAGRALERTL